MLDWIYERVRVRALFVIAAALGVLSVFVGRAEAADLNVAWKNATTYTDGSPLAATDIASTTAWCGLSATHLTLSTTVTGSGQSALVSGALAGYVCGAAHTLKDGRTSALSMLSGAVSVPAPKPSPPTGVSATVSATNPTAYKMRQSVDGYSFVAIGTVAPGTSCDVNHSADGLTPVPRIAVTLASKFDTMPLVVFAKCS